MKKTSFLALVLTLLTLAQSVARPHGPRKPGKPGKPNLEDAAERLAMREEQRLQKIDSHALLKDPQYADKRNPNLPEYSKHTYKRIVGLTLKGALTEDQSNAFKKAHSEIITEAKNAGAKDNPEARKKAREQLDKLNDEINAAVQKADEDSKRTPLVNLAQHRFEEKIKFGEQSGRLSKGEASSLRRKVESLQKKEERLKNGATLSTREREKLMEETLKISREIKKELLD